MEIGNIFEYKYIIIEETHGFHPDKVYIKTEDIFSIVESEEYSNVNITIQLKKYDSEYRYELKKVKSLELNIFTVDELKITKVK